ncbi:MAG: hypothetical protein AAB483_02660 [Patescibacteria group bacterium]
MLRGILGKAIALKFLLLNEFLTKHPISLTDNERRLCGEAIEIMKRATDVHHDHTHVFRLLGYLDEFIATPDFQNIKNIVDLKIIFLAIICHDLWRSKKDAHTAFQMMQYMFLEHFGGPSDFRKLAKKYAIDPVLSKKVSYCIMKHTHLVIVPLKTLEAKIVKAIDEIDHTSDERITLLEKKFLLDRPITSYYLKQARLAVRLYVKADTTPTHYFPSIESRILAKKQLMADRLDAEIADYAVLLEYKNKKDNQAYQNQFEAMKQKFQL